MKSGTFGAYLKLLRERKGYTLREISEKCGISLRSYLRYEAGEALPKSKLLDKLAEVLSVNEGEIEELKTRLNLLRDQEISRRVGISNEQLLTFVPSEYLRTDKEMIPTLAEYILADMKKKGITSDILAEEAGIDKVKLKSILLGEEAPDVDEIKAIARVLG
ncbi:MAG: helix-turn-helix domain-containing protein, partial [Candidatus Aenigmatarchaeota archaeon]